MFSPKFNPTFGSHPEHRLPKADLLDLINGPQVYHINQPEESALYSSLTGASWESGTAGYAASA
jgi:hypothetical protein